MLEQVAEKLTFPCPHEGCDREVRFKDMPLHKKFCCFGPVPCLKKDCHKEFSRAEDWAAHRLAENGGQLMKVRDSGEVDLLLEVDPERPFEPVTAWKVLLWKSIYFFFDMRPSPVCTSHQIARLFVVDIGESFRESTIYYNVSVCSQNSGMSASATLVSESIRFCCNPFMGDGVSLMVPQSVLRLQNSDLHMKLKIGVERHMG